MFNMMTAIRSAGGAVPELPVISGLRGHWDAALGVNEISGDISSWEDQSGNGNHWNTNTATKPTAIASVLSGNPVVSFGGLASMSQAAFMVNGEGGEMISVFRQRAIPSAANGWSSFTTSNATAYLTAAADTISDHFGTTLLVSGVDHLGQLGQDEWAYYDTHMAGTTSQRKLMVSGAVVYGTNPLWTPNFNTLGTYYLGDGQKGNAVGAGEGFVGEIAESVFYAKVLSSLERDSIYEYFDAKYGLTFAGAPLKANLIAHWDETTIQSGGDGTEITEWTDKTGNGWNLTPWPTISAPIHRVANLNGRGVSDHGDPIPGDFTIQRGYELDTSGGAPLTGSNPGSIYVVAITDSAPGVNGSGMFNTSDASGLSNHHPWTNNQIYQQFGSTTRLNFGQNQYSTHLWHTFSCTSRTGLKRCHASSSDFVIQQYGPGLNGDGNVVDWNELTNWSFGVSFQGRIAEILLYDVEHNTAEIEAVHRTLKKKWGI